MKAKAATTKSKESPKETRILTLNHPEIGNVPMFFYIPRASPKFNELSQIIKKNGGIVVPQHEACSFQIADKAEGEIIKSQYFAGDIYDSTWITQSVDLGKVQAKKKSKVAHVDEGTIPYSALAAPRNFTITEALKMYDLAEQNKHTKVKSRNFWLSVEEKHIFPHRSAEGMRGFYKKICELNREQYIKQAVREGTRYSFNFDNAPRDSSESSLPVFPSKKFLNQKSGLRSTFDDEESKGGDLVDQIEKYEPIEKFFELENSRQANLPKIDEATSNLPVDSAKKPTKQATTSKKGEKETSQEPVPKKKESEVKSSIKRPRRTHLKEEDVKLVTIDLKEIKSARKYDSIRTLSDRLTDLDRRYIMLNAGSIALEKEFEGTDIIYTKIYDSRYVEYIENQSAQIEVNRNFQQATRFVEIKKSGHDEILFDKINRAIRKLSLKFNRSEDEIALLLYGVNGDIQGLEDLLEGRNIVVWGELEDMALTRPVDSAEYKFVLHTKGEDACDKRRAFLKSR